MSTQRTAYPSDLSDAEWDILKSSIPHTKSNNKNGGRPEKYTKREIVNAILYLVASGCRYSDLPHDLPKKSTVWRYFNTWSTSGVWKRLNTKLRKAVRTHRGRTADPSCALIDSQTVKGSCIAEHSGYDAGKKIKGRKRHLLTDTQGLILNLKVHSADIQDRDGAKLLLRQSTGALTSVKKILADGGYAGKLIAWVQDKCNTVLEIVKRNELHKFVVLPKRWIIERTNAWVSIARRLSKDYERKVLNQESMIYVRMIRLMVGWVIG